jgi:Rrf2 family iron-sulfur cluster assembly transcriptional regulator
MISKTGVHAALAMALMARLNSGEFIGAAQIAREIGAPQNYLGKLLNTLANAGLLVSQKGFGGGFRLAKAARKISLYDVVEPIDKVSRWGDCLLGRGKCREDKPCTLHHRWKKVREGYLDFLKTTTLEDLADKKVTLP